MVRQNRAAMAVVVKNGKIDKKKWRVAERGDANFLMSTHQTNYRGKKNGSNARL